MNDILKLKDKELLEKFKVLVTEEKEATASVVAHLAEIDRRRLYALEGYSSLFNYCVEKHHYSESEAFLRIQAARLSQSYSQILKFLEKDQMTLTTIKLISPYLTNRKLPEASKTAQILTRCATSSLVKKEAIKPIASKRFKIEFSASEDLAKKIQRAKEILRHKYPKGRLEDILDEALELLLEKKDPERTIKKEQLQDRVSHKKHETSLTTYYYPQVAKLEAKFHPSVKSESLFQPRHKTSVPGSPSPFLAKKPPN